jgi:uncharacterized protein (TIGR00251 family)
MLQLKHSKQGLVLRVFIQPRSSVNQIVGIHKEALKIKLTAPPADGKANKALLEFLARELGVSKSCFQILSGHSSRDKQIGIMGVEAEDILKLIKASAAIRT